MEKHFGHYLRILYWCNDQSVTTALAQMELTAAQGPILGYLAHRDTPPCARDIEEEFHLRHPTVSGLLSRLEKKGFIEFRCDESDRRCKRIFLLEKGKQCNDRIRQVIRSNEAQLVRGFSPEETAMFENFLRRAMSNMGVSPCSRCNKEESDPL